MVGVRILGAGPAGSAAALAALKLGARVDIFEKTPFPRHKVCGEFLSPECAGVLRSLGVWEQLRTLKPPGLKRLRLQFGNQVSVGDLDEPAWGLSRYALDQALLLRAVAEGAVLHREKGEKLEGTPTVVATGRSTVQPKGRRLFGFKAHFDGPANDVMELYFLNRLSYVGVNAIEDGVTNVCGLASEEMLSSTRFDIDDYLDRQKTLRQRLSGLKRKWKWLIVGPLDFDNRVRQYSGCDTYYAGDSLSFVDPFTGSGILSALAIGRLAGESIATGCSVNDYNVKCVTVLRRQLLTAQALRLGLAAGWAYKLARFVPAQWLFRWTRPRVSVP